MPHFWCFCYKRVNEKHPTDLKSCCQMVKDGEWGATIHFPVAFRKKVDQTENDKHNQVKQEGLYLKWHLAKQSRKALVAQTFLDDPFMKRHKWDFVVNSWTKNPLKCVLQSALIGSTHLCELAFSYMQEGTCLQCTSLSLTPCGASHLTNRLKFQTLLWRDTWTQGQIIAWWQDTVCISK